MKKFVLRVVIISSVSIFLIGCFRGRTREIKVDNMIARGEIGSNNTYNGQIDFFDASTHRLIAKENYVDNVQNGASLRFYGNGAIKFKGSYVMGKLHGYAYLYDSAGSLLLTNYYYFGLPGGPIIRYSNGLISDYLYYSLDGDLLFEINYDSIGIHKITDIVKGFFAFTTRTVGVENAGEATNPMIHLFLYKFSPPGYEFLYDLVSIDQDYHVIDELKKFNANQPWEDYDFQPQAHDKIQYFAIRLRIKNKATKSDIVLFKKI